MAEREQMTDQWLEDAFKRALFLGNCAPDEPAANVLRGFANRVLQQFGDREGMRDALNVAYTREKAAAGAPTTHAYHASRHPNGYWCPQCVGPASAAGVAVGGHQTFPHHTPTESRK